MVVDDYSWGLGSGMLRAVKELLVELGAVHVVVRGNCAYWQGISGERGRTRGDALIVYRKGLVLKGFCGMWMTGSQTEWNIWMVSQPAQGAERHMHVGRVTQECIIAKQPPTKFHYATLVAHDVASGKGM